MSKALNGVVLAGVTLVLTLGIPVAEAKKNKLQIDLREWNVTLDSNTVQAGELDVRVRNKGDEIHELVFIKLNTDLATGRLPVDKDGAIDEERMTFGTLVDEIEGIEPGKKAKATLNLKPGRYAVICNVVENEEDGSIEAHYSMGMHAVLNVE